MIVVLDEELTDQRMEQWYRQRLSKQQLERKPARSLNLTRLIQYNPTQVSLSILKFVNSSNQGLLQAAHIHSGYTGSLKRGLLLIISFISNVKHYNVSLYYSDKGQIVICFFCSFIYSTIHSSIYYLFSSHFQGLYFTVEQAFGLPPPSFVNALVYVSLGPEARSQGKTSEGHGGDESTLFDKRDFDSLLKSPRWINEPKVSKISKKIMKKRGA